MENQKPKNNRNALYQRRYRERRAGLIHLNLRLGEEASKAWSFLYKSFSQKGRVKSKQDLVETIVVEAAQKLKSRNQNDNVKESSIATRVEPSNHTSELSSMSKVDLIERVTQLEYWNERLESVNATLMEEALERDY